MMRRLMVSTVVGLILLGALTAPGLAAEYYVLDTSGNGNHGLVVGATLTEGPTPGDMALAFDASRPSYVVSLQKGMLDWAKDVVMEIDLFVSPALWTDEWGIVAGIHSGTGSTSRENIQLTVTRHKENALEVRTNTDGNHVPHRLFDAGQYDGQWVTLRIEFSPNQVKGYVNGELVLESSENVGPSLYPVGQPFYLSTQNTAYDFGARVFIGKISRAVLIVNGEKKLEWLLDELVPVSELK